MPKLLNTNSVLVAALLAGPIASLVAVISFPLTELYNKSGPPGSERAVGLDIPFNPPHLLFDAIFVVSIAAYLAAAYLMPTMSNPRLRWLIIAAPIASALIMIFFYPLTSTDIYDLIFRAHITNRGGNPLTDLPCSYRFVTVTSCDPGLDRSPIAHDPLYAFVAWFNDPSPYGPAWELLATLPNKLAGTDLLTNLFAFKLVALGSLAACAGLVAAIARQLGGSLLHAYYIFAASPLVLFDAIGNGHNDLTLVAFMLLGYLLLLRGSLWVALPALALAVLIKFVPLLLVLLVLAYGIRRLGGTLSLRQTIVGGTLSLGLAVVAYLPFWKGWESIAPLHRTTLFTNSLAAAAVNLAPAGPDRDLARTIALLGIAVFILALVGWHTRKVWLAPTDRLDATLIESSAEVLLYFAAFGLAWWQPWYFLWALPFLALRLSHGRLLLLAAIHVIAFMYYFSNTLEKVKIGPGDHENWVGLFIFLPLFAVIAWRWWQGRQQTNRVAKKAMG